MGKKLESMKKLFQYQFEYNDWANELIINTLLNIKSLPENSVKIISHIICTQDIWLDRVIGSSDYTFSIWEEYSIYECLALSKLSTEKWLNYLKRASEKEIRSEFQYENAEDEYIEFTLERAISHIITHSSYHRGQINLALRLEGKIPPKTDVIYFPGFTVENE